MREVKVNTKVELASAVREMEEAESEGFTAYAICDDAGTLCHDCIEVEFSRCYEAVESDCPDDRQWKVVAVEIGDESPVWCDHCGKLIE